MSRTYVRSMKRAINEQRVPNLEERHRALIALLNRSIQFRHRRLAVLRLCEAAEAGAHLLDEHWRYCKGVLPGDDLKLCARFTQATQRHPMVHSA